MPLVSYPFLLLAVHQPSFPTTVSFLLAKCSLRPLVDLRITHTHFPTSVITLALVSFSVSTPNSRIMFSFKTSLVAALAVVPAMATASNAPSSVNVYFGQNGNAYLSDVCDDDSLEYITLGFVNVSPENGGGAGYPGTNFANHCWAGNYDNNGYVSDLLNDCPYLNPSVDTCQSVYKKKILLSIGGVLTEDSNYTVSTPENGVEFANFIWGAFGPYDPSWEDKPRPFDHDDVHVAVDGYDFDIEADGQ